MLKQIILVLAMLTAPALSYSFTGNARSLYRPTAKSSMRMETFGFSFAEDGAAFVPDEILGEEAIKSRYAPGLAKAGIVDRPFISEDYPVLTRVAEMNLLSKIAEAGILSSLSAKGLTLSQIERLLPVIDDLGLLNAGLANKEILLNLLVPLLVEPAPLLLGPLAAAIKNPLPLFLGGGAVGALAVLPVASGESPNIALLPVAALLLAAGQLFSGGLAVPDSMPTFTGSSGSSGGASPKGQTGLRI